MTSQLSLYLSALSLCLTLPLNTEASPRFVPDRPGYADSTESVEAGHHHLEYGGGWRVGELVDTSLMLRRGLSERTELRLGAPSLTQPLQEGSALGVSAPSVGVKGAMRWGERSASSVLTLSLPVHKKLTASPLLGLTLNMSAPLTAHYSYTLNARVGLEGEASSLGEEAQVSYAGSAALGRSAGSASLFAQAGYEGLMSQGDLFVGGGVAWLLADARQVDLELNVSELMSGAPLLSLAFGSSLGW